MTATAVSRAAAVRPVGSSWHMVEYGLIAAKRYWRGVLVVGLVTPLTYVLALGVGLGAVVDQNGNDLGVPYLVFVAPAFLTAAALQIAANEATFPVMAGFRWQRIFHGIAATPMKPEQICDGLLLGLAIRLFVNSAIYLAIMAAFGGTQRWSVVLAVPIATLTAMAFATPVAALAASVRAEGNAFNVLFRFVVTPMFLFSGTFYPISTLPIWGQWLASVSPLWHGTELARASGIGGLGVGAAIVHVAYLVAWLVVGLLLARWRFRVRTAE